MNIVFVFRLEQSVTTLFGAKGIVDMCAVDETGNRYYVKTEAGDAWFKEAQLTAA